jgi:hypothetical protein
MHGVIVHEAGPPFRVRFDPSQSRPVVPNWTRVRLPPQPPSAVFWALSLGLHAAAAAVVLHTTTATFQPTSDGLVGETLEVEPPQQAPEEETVEPAAETAAVPAPVPVPASASAPAPAPAPAPASALAPALAPASASASAPPPLPFGAAGVRYATDLPTTFTRSFPQAASADPAWASAPYGSAGSATVSLVIDENGRLTSSAILGSPSSALRRGIERTIALIEPRAFTASAAITRLRVNARVARDDVHDGLHGEVFAVSGGSFAKDVGSAFFALPSAAGSGRRVDVEVRLLP